MSAVVVVGNRHVEQVVSVGVCGGVQPELLVVEPNHCFVECELIRRLTGFGL